MLGTGENAEICHGTARRANNGAITADQGSRIYDTDNTKTALHSRRLLGAADPLRKLFSFPSLHQLLLIVPEPFRPRRSDLTAALLS